MRAAGDLDRFISLTLYPCGNRHIAVALSRYKDLLTDEGKPDLLACTFERYIDCLDGSSEINDWKAFLQDRYLVQGPA